MTVAYVNRICLRAGSDSMPSEVIELPLIGDCCYSISDSGLLKYKVNCRPDKYELTDGLKRLEAYQLQLDPSYIKVPLHNNNKVFLWVDDRCLQAMIDTGASINVIPDHILHTLNPQCVMNMRNSRVKQCYLANNDVVGVSSMVDVCIKLGNSFHVITFHILSTGTDIILGLEFLQH